MKLYIRNENLVIVYILQTARRSDKTCLYGDDVFIPAPPPQHGRPLGHSTNEAEGGEQRGTLPLL